MPQYVLQLIRGLKTTPILDRVLTAHKLNPACTFEHFVREIVKVFRFIKGELRTAGTGVKYYLLFTRRAKIIIKNPTYEVVGRSSFLKY